jgi:hypothetical protein
VADLCRKGGFSDATFYKWRAKFGGMACPTPSGCASWRRRTPSSRTCWPRRTWTCTRSRRSRGKALAPQAKREAIGHDRGASDVRAARLPACGAQPRQLPPRRPVTQRADQALAGKIVEIAQARRRFGYRRVHDLLREGLPRRQPQAGVPLYSEANLACASARRPAGHRPSARR